MSSPSSKRHRVDLPTEVLYEVFFRLPSLKPVYRFRCVSKLWNSLLSDPSFINKIYNRLTIIPWIFLYDPSNEQLQLYLHRHHEFIEHHDVLSFEFLLDTNLFKKNKIEKVCLIDSCSNGLVLLAEQTAVDFEEERDSAGKARFYFICNPLTKQWEALPRRPNNGSERFYWTTKLVCDTSTVSLSDHHSICNYKVFYIEICMNCNCSLQIFSSDTGEWKTIEIPGLKDMGYGFSEMVARHGVFYSTGQVRTTNGKKIKMVDVATAYNFENKRDGIHEFRSIDIPLNGTSTEDVYIIRSFFGESEGSIFYGHIFYVSDRNIRQRRYCPKVFLNVWLLEDDYTNGGLKWQMVHNSIELKGYRTSRNVEVMFINPVDRNVIIIVDRGCCLAYNIRTLTYEVLRGCPIPYKLEGHDFRPILIILKPTVIPPINIGNSLH